MKLRVKFWFRFQPLHERPKAEDVNKRYNAVGINRSHARMKARF